MQQRVSVPPGRDNPFDTGLAHAHSSYAAWHDGQLVRPDGQVPSPLACQVHERFRAFVLDPAFSCLGARSAVQRGAYRTGLYPDLGSAAATAGLARDLFSFVEELPALSGGFTTFVASFSCTDSMDEEAFEAALWRQLQALHEEDRHFHPWDATVSADPEAEDFSFSFAGRAFFVVGMHPGSSRTARRFGWPTLVFNAHDQFERLRAEGRFDRIRALIREREQALQGSLNPNLTDFGERSEARQYSGRAVGDAWRCPFHVGGAPAGEEETG